MSAHLQTVTETASATASQQRQLRSGSITGESFVHRVKLYPPAAAEYEEVAQDADLFWETLKGFHKSFGTEFKVPAIGGKALDLHRLFVEVASRGGLEKVIRDRRWKEIIIVFNFPSTITSPSFVLRKYYMSLLYHYEQLYYFHHKVPPISMPDPVNKSVVSRSTLEVHSVMQLPGLPLQLGSSLNGTIDRKFDNGYLITVNLGSEQLKGVLYHVPETLHVSQNSDTSRKRSRMAFRDPSRPKSNRSGYNFFFAEHYTRLKPLYHGQERAISKKIGFLWSNLTEAEKQIYQEKGLRDKERYRAEMLQYKSSFPSNQQ